MKLRIDSKVSYDVDVRITTETESIELKLKEEETCQIDIKEKHAVLAFNEKYYNLYSQDDYFGLYFYKPYDKSGNLVRE